MGRKEIFFRAFFADPHMPKNAKYKALLFFFYFSIGLLVNRNTNA
jgi:hypothetical protein